jgi:hypothetical protein
MSLFIGGFTNPEAKKKQVEQLLAQRADLEHARQRVHNLLQSKLLCAECAAREAGYRIKLELLARFVLGWKRGCELDESCPLHPGLLSKLSDEHVRLIVPLGWYAFDGRYWANSAHGYWNPFTDSEHAYPLIQLLLKDGYSFTFSSSTVGVECEMTNPDGIVEICEEKEWYTSFSQVILLIHPSIPSRPEMLEKMRGKTHITIKGNESIPLKPV